MVTGGGHDNRTYHLTDDRDHTYAGNDLTRLISHPTMSRPRHQQLATPEPGSRTAEQGMAQNPGPGTNQDNSVIRA